MKTKKGLGKGLDALLGANRTAPVKTASVNEEPENREPAAKAPLENLEQESSVNKVSSNAASMSSNTLEKDPVPTNEGSEQVLQLSVERCQKGKYQPRRVIDNEGLEELAASIKQQGIMQPIVVRPIQGCSTEFEIIAGERRWRAAQLAGLHKVPAIVREVNDEAAIAMALIENLQRDNLNPMDEAYALYRLQQEFELTHQEVADAVGKSRSAVSNALRLMGLSKEVKLLLENGDIEMGHARAILALPENQQPKAAAEVVDKRLNVRQTESLVKNLLKPKPKPSLPKLDSEVDANIRSLETDLSEKLGAAVTIQHNPKGKGKLVVSYSSLDELDGILDHIR